MSLCLPFYHKYYIFNVHCTTIVLYTLDERMYLPIKRFCEGLVDFVCVIFSSEVSFEAPCKVASSCKTYQADCVDRLCLCASSRYHDSPTDSCILCKILLAFLVISFVCCIRCFTSCVATITI